MWPQIAAILWAQFRTTRNHLPRLGIASILGNALSALWYATILTGAIGIAAVIPSFSLLQLTQWLPVTLLALFALWQLVPLFTLSTGWSLQLNKLQIYPIRTGALFGIEVLLRITGSPEFILVLLGLVAGLLRHPAVPALAPLSLLLYLPLNLLLSLAVRELVLHSFSRNRFREILSLLLLSLAVLPQLLLRRGMGNSMPTYMLTAATLRGTPWRTAAALALGHANFRDLAILLIWIALAYKLARWFFVRSLQFEETPQAGSLSTRKPNTRAAQAESRVPGLLYRLFGDPLAALLQKEAQSLRRMPRFRVAFGLACIFSLLIFFPLSMNTARVGNQFLNHHFLPVVMLYGLLILSDSLLLNVFGPDRAAAALYFVAPIPFATVLKAKNLIAAFFIAAQCLLVLGATAALRRTVTPLDALTALGAVTVVGVFFASLGNLTSITLARPTDPRQTFRKAAGGKLQLWLFASVVGMSILLGAALLAQYALNTYWALLAVLALELILGLIFYKVALDSALERAHANREKLIDTLSKGANLIGSTN